MPKLWKLKSQIPQEKGIEIVNFLLQTPHPVRQSTDHLLPKGEGNLELLSQLLYNRGLSNKDQVADFLNPTYEKLHSPFLFKDMQQAVDRIWQAINHREKICIYGDYDADAVTANAVLRQTFNFLDVEADSYIPDRFSEGYGVNIEALEKIAQNGAKIIITVDCGTNSIDAADWCKARGIDFIITDHHEIIGQEPDAYALINPKNGNDSYPYREITGVGVAFKLACAILKDPRTKLQVPKYAEGYEKWLLDLVAIGTVADCHSLLGENRILVKYGLKVLAKTKWIGLKALAQAGGLDFSQKLPDTYTLGFVIAPRLNAAGRLEHAGIALDLLLEQNPFLAKEKAARLEQINQRRQQLTQTVLSEAKEKAIMLMDRKVLVMVGQGWPKGVMGLVAGRLAEEYFKPVIVLEQTENLCTGSARTAGEFNLIEALKFSSEHIVKFGGHKQAAGLTVEISKFDLFYQKILEHADLHINETNADKVLELEAELQAFDINVENLEQIKNLEPFGVGNPKPKFLVKAAKVLSQRQVGTQSQHLQLNLGLNNSTFSAIAFNFKPLQITNVDIACELIEDGWNGSKNLKLRIVDVKAS